jgi:hypothetical protein
MTDVTPPPPAPQSPAVPAPESAEVAPVATVERKGSGPGIASLLLSLLAILADIVILVIAVVAITSVIANFDFATFDVGTALAGLGATAFLAVVGFFGGIVLALLALLIGIIAIARNRGRVAGVFGVIFSILVLITHGSVALAIAQSGEAISGITGLLPTG